MCNVIYIGRVDEVGLERELRREDARPAGALVSEGVRS